MMLSARPAPSPSPYLAVDLLQLGESGREKPPKLTYTACVSLPHQVRLELLTLHRRARFWFPATALVWALLLRLQEPVFFQRLSIPFYWESIEALGLLFIFFIPPLWWLWRGEKAEAWTLCNARRPGKVIAGMWLGLALFILIQVGALLILAYTVDRIYGGGSALRSTLLFGHLALTAIPATSLALCVASFRLPNNLSIPLWFGAIAACVLLGYPFPAGSGPEDKLTLASTHSMFIAVQATAGGLFFCIALASYRIRR